MRVGAMAVHTPSDAGESLWVPGNCNRFRLEAGVKVRAYRARRVATKIVWYGPPFWSLARTRWTLTVKPAWRSRCSNLRSSHADQTARTPLADRASRAVASPRSL